MLDDLGNRMKSQYEDRTRYFLPRRSYTIVRVDGKAFHSYTKKCKRPYDLNFMSYMDRTAMYLCEKLQGSQFAYVQSDEISVLLTDFYKPTTSAWFDGNIQKISSVAASLATGIFNHITSEDCFGDEIAAFDARCFTIPDNVEVENYFIWRQQDCTKNSISMAAQSQFSHKELHGKNGKEMQEMLFQKGINWNEYPWQFKRGRTIVYSETQWMMPETPIFTQDRDFLKGRIPLHWPDPSPTGSALVNPGVSLDKILSRIPWKNEHPGF